MDKLTCARCGSTDVVPIVFGMPGFDLVEAEKRGEVILGGCIRVGDEPTVYCPRCDGSASAPPPG